MHAFFAALNKALFHVGADGVTAAEMLGFITGAASVWLTVRVRVSNFPVGIANSAFFLVLFLDAHLFANAALQVIYIALGLAGWWMWLHRGRARGERPMRPAAWPMLLALALAVVAATAVLMPILSRAGGAAPFWDALTTSLSLAAQWLLNDKRPENWYVWAAADLIYIPLYAVERLYLTSFVYLLFLLMCVVGMREWHRRARLQATTPSAAPALP